MKVAIGVQRMQENGTRVQHAEDILELRVLPEEWLTDLWIVAEGLEVCRLPLYMREAPRREAPHEKWVREYVAAHDLSEVSLSMEEALGAAYQAGAAHIAADVLTD